MPLVTINDLEKVLDKVPEDSKGFALSLITKGKKYGVTPKQAYWVERLYQRAMGKESDEPPQVKLEGDLKPMMVMLQFAKQHLKFPKVRLLLPSAKRELAEHGKSDLATSSWLRKHTIRLAIAGDRSKYAGQVQVTDSFPYGENTWYGRIDKDGTWTQPRSSNELSGEVAETLAEFSKDPVQAATAYGKLMGHCCFCNRELTDARSTEVGYGPDCASHYGLPWGSK